MRVILVTEKRSSSNSRSRRVKAYQTTTDRVLLIRTNRFRILTEKEYRFRYGRNPPRLFTAEEFNVILDEEEAKSI